MKAPATAARGVRPPFSLFLEAANRNQFSELLLPDMGAGELREAFLANLPDGRGAAHLLAAYAAKFVAWTAGEPAQRAEAAADLGLDPGSGVPAGLFDARLRQTFSPPSAGEERLLGPGSALELAQTRQGGAVRTENLDWVYCPAGTAAYRLDSTSPPAAARRPTIPVHRRSCAPPGRSRAPP